MLVVLDQFKGSMIGKKRYEDQKVFLQLKKEATTRGFTEDHDYNLHFHFGIENTEERDIDVSFFIGCDEKEELKDPFVRLWVKKEDEEEYRMIGINGRMTVPGKYSFDLKVDRRSTIYIANFLPLDHLSSLGRMEETLGSAGGEKVIIGRSVEGREIPAYRFVKNKDNPNMVFISGFHPPECDFFAVETIFEEIRKNRDELLMNYNIILLPLVNPDGYHHMLQGSNVNHINFFWKFLGNTEDDCPEAHAVWNYCRKIRPVFYMDFHAFTFQNNDKRPYTIPPMLNCSGKGRKVQNMINREFSSICGTQYPLMLHFITPFKILAPDLLSTGLMKEFGTVISPKFHTHMKDGLEESRSVVRDCFNEAVEIMNSSAYKGSSGNDCIISRAVFTLNRTIHRSRN